jgi:hypothetical protein
MPIPEDHIRVTFIGAGPQTEVFNTGFWINTNGSTYTSTELNTLATAIRDAWVTNCRATWCSLMHSDQQWKEVRTYWYNGGPTPNQAQAVGVSTITGAAGTISTKTSLAHALVATLKSNFAGRSYRGRMYLPATGYGYQTGTWTYSTTGLQAVADSVGNLFGTINGWASPIRDVVIVSPLKTATSKVVSVVVDDKPDIQRRRMNKIVQANEYTKAVVA